MQAQIIVNELNRSINCLNQQDIDNFVKKVESHKRIFVYGMGRSGLMLKALAMRLMQLGFIAYVVGETTTPAVQKGDLLIVASASGETGTVNLTVESALKQGVAVASITSTPSSTLGKLQSPDLVVESGTKFTTSQVSVQPLGSLFEQMLLIMFDTIILIISDKQSNANEHMANKHASLE